MSQPNGLWYGIDMPISRDEPTTEDNPIKVYDFGWVNKAGKKRMIARFYRSLEAVVKAADLHRKQHGFTGYHVVGTAIAGFAF